MFFCLIVFFHLADLLQDTCLIQGIVVDKDFSHPQMPKSVKDGQGRSPKVGPNDIFCELKVD